MEQGLKEGPSRDFPTWGYIMAAVSKPDTVGVVKKAPAFRNLP